MADYATPSGVSFTRSGNNVWYKNTTSSRYLFNVGDTLWDPSTGEKYECKARTYIQPNENRYRLTTDWKYVSTSVRNPPAYSVSDLTLKRNSGYSFTLSWKTPSAMLNSESNSRAENIVITVELVDTSEKVSHRKEIRVDAKTTSYTMLVFATSSSSTSYLWKRDLFRPYNNDKYDVAYIRFTVRASNSMGTSSYSSKVRYNFTLPKAPTYDEYKIDKTSGDISVKLTSPIDTNTERDNIYNHIIVTVHDSRTGKVTRTKDYATSEGTFTLTQSIPNRHTLTYGDYVYVTFRVGARGIFSNYYLSYGVYESFPQKPIVSLKSASQDWVSGNAVIAVNLRPSYQKDYVYGVSNVKLQVLRSVTYENANDIPPTAQWRDIGPTEDSYCTAISLQIPEILPDAGKVTWVRAKSWNDVEELYYRYSEPLRLKDLETPAPVIPSAQDDMADVLSHVVNVDGTSVDILIGWDANGQDDSNKTEVAWSTNEKAWRSTKQPDTFTFDDDWDEGPVTVGSKTYNKSAHVTISELEPDTKYYVSCRRVLEPDEGDTTYGPYSTKFIVNTNDVSALPQTVVLYANTDVIYGEPIQVSWNYGSPMEQQSWMIKKAVNSSGYSEDDIVLAMENDPRHALKVPFYRDENEEYPIVDEDELRLYVVVTVASVTLTSEIITLDVLRRPEFDIVAPSMTIVQPATLAVFSDTKGASVSYFIEAKNVVSDYPNGTVRQSDGDTVWSETVNPQWELIDEYAADTDVQQAKQDLDDAQDAYDALSAQYQDAVSRRDDAESRIETLTVSISNAQRDIPTAQATLQDAEDRLENTDEDDPMYELYVTQVQEAEDYLQGLEDRLQADTAALSEAEDDLSHWMDYAPREIAELTAKGHAEQDGTPTPDNPVPIQVVMGRNLCPYLEQGYWAFADGSETSNNMWVRTPKIGCDPDTYYTATSEYLTSYIGFVWYDKNGSFISASTIGQTSQKKVLYSAKSPSNAAYMAFDVQGAGGGSAIAPSDIKDLQINAGPTPQSYVPYGHVGLECGGSLYGRNLFRGNYVPLDKPIPQGSIIIASAYTSGTEYVYLYRKDGTQIDYWMLGPVTGQSYKARKLTVSEDVYSVRFSGYDGTYNVQIEYDDGTGKTTEYDPWYHTTTPIPLPSRGWVAGLPDGTADSLRLDGAGKCEWTLPTSEITYDGSESWTYDTNSDIKVFRSPAIEDTLAAIENGRVAIVSHFVNRVANFNTLLNHQTQLSQLQKGVSKTLIVRFDEYTTLADFKTWLSTHNVTILYPLATPVTEDCGYVDTPTIPAHATVTIPELDEVGITYEVDMHDEEEALREAIEAYATAEADAIDPTSDALAYKAIVTLPSFINVIDGARYLVHGFSTNSQSGVRSDERTTAMNVEWSHQAPMPYEDISIEPIDQTDDAGVRTIGTNITLERPVNAFDSDVYDVYRVTKGGVSLAAENVPLECVLFDPYATFSGELMHYRIACRTADGDVTWKDYSYLLNESEDVLRSAMRIDWENEYVELERNVVPSDSYEKPFVSHTHLDGTVSGHWNAGTRRTMNVQAALVRIYDNRQREAIEHLARYDGPCYVRTNDGVAFECNVQVDSIALSRHSARIDISMTMTEIEATGTFMATVEEQA